MNQMALRLPLDAMLERAGCLECGSRFELVFQEDDGTVFSVEDVALRDQPFYWRTTRHQDGLKLRIKAAKVRCKRHSDEHGGHRWDPRTDERVQRALMESA